MNNELSDLFVENQETEDTVIVDGNNQTRIVRSCQVVTVNALGQRQYQHTTVTTMTEDGALVMDAKIYTCRNRRCKNKQYSEAAIGPCEDPCCKFRFCKQHLYEMDGKRYCRKHWWIACVCNLNK